MVSRIRWSRVDHRYRPGPAGLFAVGQTGIGAGSFIYEWGVVMIGVTAMFVMAGLAVTHRAQAVAASQLSRRRRIVDHVLSPMPSNPFCWDLLLVQDR